MGPAGITVTVNDVEVRFSDDGTKAHTKTFIALDLLGKAPMDAWYQLDSHRKVLDDPVVEIGTSSDGQVVVGITGWRVSTYIEAAEAIHQVLKLAEQSRDGTHDSTNW